LRHAGVVAAIMLPLTAFVILLNVCGCG